MVAGQDKTARMAARAVRDGPLARMGRSAGKAGANEYAPLWKPKSIGESAAGWLVEIRRGIQPRNPQWPPFDVLVLADESRDLTSVLVTAVLRDLADEPPPELTFVRVKYAGTKLSAAGNEYKRYGCWTLEPTADGFEYPAWWPADREPGECPTTDVVSETSADDERSPGASDAEASKPMHGGKVHERATAT